MIETGGKKKRKKEKYNNNNFIVTESMDQFIQVSQKNENEIVMIEDPLSLLPKKEAVQSNSPLRLSLNDEVPCISKGKILVTPLADVRRRHPQHLFPLPYANEEEENSRKINDVGKSEFWPSPLPSPSSSIIWECHDLIGEGTFGKVYSGINVLSGEPIAVKFIKKGDAEASLAFWSEVSVLASCCHPNIVRFLGAEESEDPDGATIETLHHHQSISRNFSGTPEWVRIFMEYVDGGSLRALLNACGPFPEPMIRHYSHQVLKGLNYLHEKGVAHRDIKASNILLTLSGCVKLADFGLTWLSTQGKGGVKGSTPWMAPEVIQERFCPNNGWIKADIWSFGCTVIEMAEGSPPWTEFEEPLAALFQVGCTGAIPKLPTAISQRAQSFLLQCLQKEPLRRPTASQLLTAPFFTGKDTEQMSINDDWAGEAGKLCRESPQPLSIRSESKKENFSRSRRHRPFWSTSENYTDEVCGTRRNTKNPSLEVSESLSEEENIPHTLDIMSTSCRISPIHQNLPKQGCHAWNMNKEECQKDQMQKGFDAHSSKQTSNTQHSDVCTWDGALGNLLGSMVPDIPHASCSTPVIFDRKGIHLQMPPEIMDKTPKSSSQDDESSLPRKGIHFMRSKSS